MKRSDRIERALKKASPERTALFFLKMRAQGKRAKNPRRFAQGEDLAWHHQMNAGVSYGNAYEKALGNSATRREVLRMLRAKRKGK